MDQHQERQERPDPCQDDVVHGVQHFLLILKALLIGEILWQTERDSEDVTTRLNLLPPPPTTASLLQNIDQTMGLLLPFSESPPPLKIN